MTRFSHSSALLCVALFLFVGALSASELQSNSTKSADPRCTVQIGVSNVQLFATSAGGPYSVASEAACLAACPTSSGWLGGTFKKSTNQCWCIKQPFGSPASGVYNTDFNSRFNPNTPTYACSSWTVANQKWMFSTAWGSGTYGPVGTIDNADCAGICASSYKGCWTRQRSTSNCWCGTGSAWQSNALLYDTDFDAGVMALL